MRNLLISVVMALVPLAAHAERTVSWYAANDAVRARVVAFCQDNPGRYGHLPDCINAQRGDLKAAADRLQNSRADRLTVLPRRPASWFRDRPAIRDTVAGACRNMNGAERAAYRNCDTAEAAQRMAGLR